MDKASTMNVMGSLQNNEEIEGAGKTKSETDSSIQSELIKDDVKTPNKLERYYYWRGLWFVGTLGAVAFLLMQIYQRFHGVSLIEAYNNPDFEWEFDFVGGNRNPASIGFEIGIWTFLGVTCRVAYTSTQAILRKRFDWLKYAIGWLGAGLYAWGIAVAVIFSFQVITLDVGGVEITLANISIEAIIAISFILGFYNDEARRLLDNIRGQIVQGINRSDENGESIASAMNERNSTSIQG